jgi:hypothetical protein
MNFGTGNDDNATSQINDATITAQQCRMHGGVQMTSGSNMQLQCSLARF